MPGGGESDGATKGQRRIAIATRSSRDRPLQTRGRGSQVFMRDGVLRVQDQAEKKGDWGSCNHENQAVAYADELPDPALAFTAFQVRMLRLMR